MNSHAKPRRSTLVQALFLILFAAGIATALSAARMPYEAKKKQRILKEAYVETVESGTPQRPWKKSDVAVAGKIVFPRLRKTYVVVTTGTEEALEAGPSLVPGTAEIGKTGTSFISAHRETHFAFLERARVGDMIQAAGADGKMRDYRVSSVEIVDIDDLTVPAGVTESQLVLFTCYPFRTVRIDDRRFVVRAELVS